MSSIKCIYYRFRCLDGTYKHQGRICRHHDTPCDEYDGCCDCADDTPKITDVGVYEIPLQCRHAYKEEVRFEELVRCYELDDDWLMIPKHKIPTDRIIRLIIDGEHVIDKGGEVDD